MPPSLIPSSRFDFFATVVAEPTRRWSVYLRNEIKQHNVEQIYYQGRATRDSTPGNIVLTRDACCGGG